MTDIYLTEDRIRAVVRGADSFYRKARSHRGRGTPLVPPATLPDIAAGETLLDTMSDQFDALMGPGGGQFLVDSSRLLYVLDVLEKGSVEDAVASHQRRVQKMNGWKVDPEVAEMMRSNGEIAEARLRAIPQREIDAVLACLDEIAAVYPGQVQAVRVKHVPAVRQSVAERAAELRTGDPSRPQLSEERIRRLLDVIAALVPGPKLLIRSLNEPGFAIHGRPAGKIFPASTVKKIRAQGEAPETFARDFTWLRIISGNLAHGESIESRMIYMIPRQGVQAWMNPAQGPGLARARAEKFATMVERPLELLSLVGHDEESAVRALLGEIKERMDAAKEIQRQANMEKRKR